MLAGGMTIAAPSMMPQAAAAGALYVSAENAMFENHFGGAQIVEIIVRDPNASETDESQPEPTVRVDNQIVRMAQGTDGYWYAYIGDDTAVTAADVADNNLDFGCDGNVGGNTANKPAQSLTLYSVSNFTNSDSKNASNACADDGHQSHKMLGVIANPPTLSNYNGTWNSSPGVTTTYSFDGTSTHGQIGVNITDWPFIQTFDFTQGDFDIILEQPGADEVVTVDHESGDMEDYASLSLDRNSATQGAEVHVFIVDGQLNIDPTNEDIVVFHVTNSTPTIGGNVSFTNGTAPSSATDMFNNFRMYDNGFADNGQLVINYNADGAANAVLVDEATADDVVADKYLVFYEDADNTGTFSNVDDADDSSLDVNASANRGTSATFDYNDSVQSFVVANDFGTIDMVESSVGDEWNSGEELTVILKDQDLNKNTLSDEDLTIALSTLIPSIQIGSPITLGNGTVVEGGPRGATSGYGTVTIDSFSKLAQVESLAPAGGALQILTPALT